VVERIDIERALDDLTSNEGGMSFQGLAVVLGKIRCPELVACERHNDLGLDAYASAAISPDGRGKGLASSTTGTFEKVNSDATKIQKNYSDVSITFLLHARENLTAQEKGVGGQDTHGVRNRTGRDLPRGHHRHAASPG